MSRGLLSPIPSNHQNRDLISGELRARRKLHGVPAAGGEPALTFGDKFPVSVSLASPHVLPRLRRGVAAHSWKESWLDVDDDEQNKLAHAPSFVTPCLLRLLLLV